MKHPLMGSWYGIYPTSRAPGPPPSSVRPGVGAKGGVEDHLTQQPQTGDSPYPPSRVRPIRPGLGPPVTPRGTCRNEGRGAQAGGVAMGRVRFQRLPCGTGAQAGQTLPTVPTGWAVRPCRASCPTLSGRRRRPFGTRPPPQV